jgi:hypothetical protein
MPPRRAKRFSLLAFGCLLGAVCPAWIPIQAKTTGQRFVVTISVENLDSQTGPEDYTVKAGSDVFIKVHLTNTSKHKLALGYDKDSRTNVDFSHQYEVRDSHGSLAQKRTIAHPEIGSTGHGWPARILKPRESMDITGDDISRLYDLSQPGAYTVQLSRTVSDDPKDGVVKSNAITVKVTPQ